MERNSCVNSVKTDLRFCFYFVLGFSMGKCNFLFLSDHAILIFNMILTFYFSLFKTHSFSYKSYIIKPIFAIFNSFTILFTFEIEQLKYQNTSYVMGEKLHFISNNVKGLQNSLKRIKISEYLKIKLGSNEFLFLQESHSSFTSEQKWADELKGPIFFSHGKRTLVE